MNAKMPRHPLIPVFSGTIQGRPAHLVNARLLHSFLGVGKVFANWIKERIEEYGFVQDQDFLICQNRQIKKGRGGDRRSIDYHLTLDMAKELSMVERNDKGREARRYFIECERKAHEARAETKPLPPPDLEMLVARIVDQRLAAPVGLLPDEQANEVVRRLEHLGKLFHPFNEYFDDVVAVGRALRGLDTKLGTPNPNYRRVIACLEAN